jgi:hypothetical protein
MTLDPNESGQPGGPGPQAQAPSPWAGPSAQPTATQPQAPQPVVPRPAPSYLPQGIAVTTTPKPSQRRVSVATAGLVVAAIIAAAGIGFAGGRATAPQAAGRGAGNGAFANGGFPNASGRGAGNGAAFGGFGGAGGAISITGSVVALGDGTMTLKMGNGSEVTVQVPSTTTYHAQAPATSTDVTVGSQVEVAVGRPQFRGGADASGAPNASGPVASPGTGGGGGGAGLSATDITVLGK